MSNIIIIIIVNFVPKEKEYTFSTSPKSWVKVQWYFFQNINAIKSKLCKILN